MDKIKAYYSEGGRPLELNRKNVRTILLIIVFTVVLFTVVQNLGALFGFKTMKIVRVGSPIAQGLSMGTAAHAVGTSAAMEVGRKYGAYASLGLTLNGIFTALLTPAILQLLGML